MAKRKKTEANKTFVKQSEVNRAAYGETARYREIQYLWHSHGKRIYII